MKDKREMNKLKALKSSANSLLCNNIEAAKQIIIKEYPFQRIIPQVRNYTDKEKIQQFVRDGFIDRYSGQKLINPGLLKVLSSYMPEEFPYHPHWKMTDTHAAYWKLTPTVDHIIPVALGGADDESNWVTTSMLHNQIKSIWTLEQLNWSLHERGDIAKWDGLTRAFMQLVERDGALMNDSYIKRWLEASQNYF